jgi:hypothetical protein
MVKEAKVKEGDHGSQGWSFLEIFFTPWHSEAVLREDWGCLAIMSRSRTGRLISRIVA